MTSLLTAPLAALLMTLGATGTPAQERGLDQIMADIAALGQEPQIDRTRWNDADYRDEFFAAREAYYEKVDALAGEAWRVAPERPEVAPLASGRWGRMAGARGEFADVTAETATTLANDAASAELATEAGFWHAQSMLWDFTYGEHETEPFPFEQAHAAARGFWTAHPQDPRSPSLMYGVVEGLELKSPEQVALLQQIRESYPDSREAAQAADFAHLLDRVGQPVELEFDDAITGEHVSMADLRGKVVVFDFWATWCGPCVAEMPHMKELYAELKGQGVEFIGISLDAPPADGGLEKLRAFVSENEIPWRQYYQGNGWESEYSTSWGVRAIPAVMVIDQEGRLAHPKARGKVREIVTALLESAS